VSATPPTVNLVMAVTVAGLFSVGFYLLLQRSLMRVLLGVVVLGHGTNLLLQLVGGPPGRAPVVGQAPAGSFADPLPQALALTAVVITFALTTFLLALGYRSFGLLGHDQVQDDVEDRRIGRGAAPAAPLPASRGDGEDDGDGEDGDDADDGDGGGADHARPDGGLATGSSARFRRGVPGRPGSPAPSGEER
jgi:multicomponent Na+:H+ antiporter subunit C